MKAVVWQAPGQIDLQEVPDARIEQPSDAVVRLGAECAEVSGGGTVAIFAGWRVGQLAIASAWRMGASQVIAVDNVPARLKAARSPARR